MVIFLEQKIKLYITLRVWLLFSVKSRGESELLTKSHHEEMLTFQTETELLAKNHEEEKQVSHRLIAQTMKQSYHSYF